MANVMTVRVTNITDGPGRSPTTLSLFGKDLAPGEALTVSVDLIDGKTRGLAGAGPDDPQARIAIGPLPSWYQAFKAKRGRTITQAELDQAYATPPPPPLALVDDVPPPADEVQFKAKQQKR